MVCHSGLVDKTVKYESINNITIPDEAFINKIYLIRNEKVMFDSDLAELYGVETKRLNEQVKRNIDRFPGRTSYIFRRYTPFHRKLLNLQIMARILAIDYGKKRVGVAVTDPMQICAAGLTTVGAHEILNFLKDYFAKEKVELVVLGWPLRLNNEESEALMYVRQFKTAFERKFPEMKLELEDERFTSKLAVQAMIDGGMKKSDRRIKSNIDKMSAAIILQSYMQGRDLLS
jgi:putative Holliday junction resolvase